MEKYRGFALVRGDASITFEAMGLKNYLVKGRLEAGCDEAGRGCLAGPVVAAAVILDPSKPIRGLDDSKKLSEKKRDALRLEIESKALSWAVGMYSPEEIDEVNILNASFLSMHRALEQLSEMPDHILVDGNRFIPFREVAHTTVIKGDGKFKSIAAASILAKTHRDELMKDLGLEYPEYLWASNKGYPSKAHRAAIKEFGVTPHHRKSFQSCLVNLSCSEVFVNSMLRILSRSSKDARTVR